MYQIVTYVPDSHLDAVKAALFAAGAGRIGPYDGCAWQVKGEGQFRPLAGSRPVLGSQGVLETVSEYRIELVCDDACIEAAVTALKQAHPYEQPAYSVWRLADC